MTEPTPTIATPLPTSKPVSAGVAPLPPLATRTSYPPPAPIEIPSMEDDYPMESDSSGSDDSDAESDISGDSASSSSSGTGSSASSLRGSDDSTGGMVSSESLAQSLLEREREHRAELERMRERERDQDRLRRMELRRERERETRSQAPPPTPRTPGGRKPVRAPRAARPAFI